MATLAFNELKLYIQIRFKLFESISFISYHSKKWIIFVVNKEYITRLFLYLLKTSENL